MISLSGIIPLIVKYAINPFIWLIIIIGFLLMTWLALYIRRRRRLVYEVAELLDFGNGKGGINTDLKAGWFGRKSYLKGLLWFGEEVLKTSDNEEIHYFSTEDYQEVNGERGVWVFRDPTKNNILVPISHANIKGKELLAAIAPADYTDVAVKIVDDANKELDDWKDKLIQFAGWALVIIVSLVLIIVIVQYVKSAQKDAAQMLMEAGTKNLDACRSMCTEAINTAKAALNSP